MSKGGIGFFKRNLVVRAQADRALWKLARGKSRVAFVYPCAFISFPTVMANTHSSPSSESGGSAWSLINVVIAGAFAVVTLGFGGSLMIGGMGASYDSHHPKPKAEAPAAAAAAPVAGAPAAHAEAPAPIPSGPLQELALAPDAVNPMAYGTKSFTVKAGQGVKLTFTNKAAVPLPHNVVVGKAGSKAALDAAAAKIMTDPNGMAKNYIPDDCPEIIAHTKLVQPGTEESITFVCPAPGEYPYMCMFPGHSIMMNGVIKAQ